MTAYYNENDPRMAATLRELIAGGHIAHGHVDERSISDVKPSDLSGFVQCHFFAGVGVWSYALRLAGWPDTRPVWTASCPCQPFSGAGKGLGFADKRHLWPDLHWLICQRRPDTLYGEQVSDTGGIAWIDLVSADMEASGYALGALIAPAAGVGAPHMRHRTYFTARRLAHDHGDRCAAAPGVRLHDQEHHLEPRGVSDGMGDPFIARLERLSGNGNCGRQPGWIDPFKAGPIATASPASDRRGPTNGFWRNADWLHGRDEKWRAVEPGTFPLVDGIARGVGYGDDLGAPTSEARLNRLHGYGNAIVAPLAAEFIRACME